jgi:hypothetical protein
MSVNSPTDVLMTIAHSLVAQLHLRKVLPPDY